MTQGKPYWGPWGVTAILSISFFMSYVDRLIVGLLVDPIKAAFHASDIQIGLLFGVTFGVVYAFVGLPLGVAVDRGNRKWLVICGLTLWSFLTIAAGFAAALPLLFLCRVGVAVGEATLSPAATSMISDLFPPKRRTFPITVFFASGMIGAGGSFIIGAAVVAMMTALVGSGLTPGWAQPWRLTFVAVGLPGLVLAILVSFLVREPPRMEVGVAGGRIERGELLSLVAGRWWGLGIFFLAVAFAELAPSAIAAWVPAILHRDYGFGIAGAGLSLGITQLMTAPTGQILIGALANLGFRRSQRGLAFAIVGAVSTAISTIMFALLPLASDATTMLILLGVAIFFSIGMTSIAPIAIGLLLPNRMRGSSIAAYYLVLALLGVGIGPVIVPWLAAYMPAKSGGYTRAMALAGVISGLVALALFAVAMFGLRRRADPLPSSDAFIKVADVPPAREFAPRGID